MSEYTNRHGKKMRVNDDEIVIEQAKPVQAPTQPAAKPKRERKPIRMTLPKLSRKVLGTIVIILAVLAFAGVVTADSTKREYERKTAAMKRSITDRSKQSSSTDTSTVAVVSSLRNSLTASTDCRVQGVDVVSWYGPAKTAREDCQNAADAYKKLQLALDDMKTMAEYANKVKAALDDGLTIQPGGDFAIISDYREAWKAGVTELEAISPPEMTRVTHTELVAKSKAARDAWIALSDANIGQNAEGFKEAEKNLNDRYAEIRTVADELKTLIGSSQASINSYITELSS